MITCLLAAAALLAVRNAEPDGAAAARAALSQALDGGEVIRLHVIASSDSPADQALKLYIRDAVLESYGAELSADDPVEARQAIQSRLPEIQALAEAAAQAYGGEPVAIQVSFAKEDFPYREYAGMVVPEGTYDSLAIRIGEAAGRNWWCVIYPPLCLMTPDTIAAAEAARPATTSRPAVRQATTSAPLPPPDRLSLRTMPTAKLAAFTAPPDEQPRPVFEFILLRWLRSLAFS